MDKHSTTDISSLRHGLAQILQCYSAGGLKRLHTQPPESFSPELLGQLIGTHSTGQETSPASVVQPPIAVDAPQVHATTTPSVVPPAAKTTRPAPPALLPENDVQLPLGNWQLPNMDDGLREAKLVELDQQVKACRKCPELVCYRRQTVFGEGNIRPRLCFFGEAPGADEDAQGRPFVGAAGKLLTDIIRAMKLTREDVYILNSLKCRPPQNRTPLPEEVDNCRPYALTQLEILQPEFIILLGAVAVRSVLQSTESVGRLRGRFHHFHGARVLVTYHPAYLLRNPDAKKLVWQDVQLVMKEMGLA